MKFYAKYDLLLPILAALSILLFGAAYAGHSDTALAQNKADNLITTTIVDHYYPYTFINENGEPDGFSVDLMKAVARVMGIQLKINTDTRMAARNGLKSGAIDFLPMMAYSDERDKEFDFTAPHTISYDGFFGRKNSPHIRKLEQLKGKKIIVMHHDQAYDFLRSLGYISDDQFIFTDNLQDTLRTLSSGEGDVALMPKLVGLVLINRLHLTNLELEPAIVEAYNRPFSVAVAEGNQELLERFSEGLLIVKETHQYQKIYDKWFSVYESSDISLLDAFQRVLWFIGAFVLVGIVLFLWSILLKRQVTLRTKDLVSEINERQKAEGALKESEERYRELFEYSPISFWEEDYSETKKIIDEIKEAGVTDLGEYFLENPKILVKCIRAVKRVNINESSVKLVNAQNKDDLLKNAEKIFPVGASDIFKAALIAFYNGDNTYEGETALNKFDGEEIWAVHKATIVPGDEDTWSKVLISVIDITKQKKSEHDLSERLEFETLLTRISTAFLNLPSEKIDDEIEARLKSVGEFLKTDSVALGEVVDPEIGPKLTYFWVGENGIPLPTDTPKLLFPWAASKLLDGEIVQFERPEDLPPEAEADIANFIKNDFKSLLLLPLTAGENVVGGCSFTNNQAHRPWPDHIINRSRLLTNVFANALARKKTEAEKDALQEKLQQSQKMEAIGTLAGGIAHDFNNILAAMIGYAELAEEKLEDSPTLKKYMNEIIKSGDRARNLVMQILSFSRRSDQERRRINISPVIKETLKLLRATLPSSIHIQGKIEADVDLVLAEPTQIHQILVNLCTNARQSMEDHGNIEVRLADVVLEDETEAANLGLEPGNFIKITVKDDGSGIPEDIILKIFDPYFTTKRQGEGTGLGLALVRGIVDDYGGAIRVSNNPDKGTTFDVLLPIEEGEAQITSIKGEEVVTGSGVILLVDDEELLVKLFSDMLQQVGFDVVCTSDSMEALEIFKRDPENFDLILSDYTMPRMTGMELAEKILEIKPEIPIILVSGFAENISVEAAREIGIKDLLNKPLKKNDLISTLNRYMK